jgi:hypothetical protein
MFSGHRDREFWIQVDAHRSGAALNDPPKTCREYNVPHACILNMRICNVNKKDLSRENMGTLDKENYPFTDF